MTKFQYFIWSPMRECLWKQQKQKQKQQQKQLQQFQMSIIESAPMQHHNASRQLSQPQGTSASSLALRIGLYAKGRLFYEHCWGRDPATWTFLEGLGEHRAAEPLPRDEQERGEEGERENPWRKEVVAFVGFS
jgi:hypothetical protein